jgi:hypothetical protein
VTRDRKARLLTIAALGLALAVAVGRNQLSRWSTERPLPTPQDAIYAMLDASRTGDIRAYLANYGGQMRAAIEHSIRESGEERFIRYLKESNSAIKGIAISEPQQISNREAAVRVEYIYQDRNEAQTMRLEQEGGVWRITGVDATDRVKTLIPYGTPVQ